MSNDYRPGSVVPSSPRQAVCLNGEWSFKSAADDGWTLLRVPGCYTVHMEEPWGRYYWDAFGYPERWHNRGARYRRSFRIPQSMAGQRIYFWCGGCFHHSRTFVNGVFAGECHDGYFPFEYDITDHIQAGENVIEVEVSGEEAYTFDDKIGSSRGIWQDTYLRSYPEVTIGWDMHVRTLVDLDRLEAFVPVRNDKAESAHFEVRLWVTDATGEVVKRFSGGDERLRAGESTEYKITTAWSDPRLWFPHDPYLYHIHAGLIDLDSGAVIDVKSVRFGFRQITWEGPHLYLNGRELFLRGHGGHYLGDLQGTKEYHLTWLQSMKERGINFMRLHDNPKHRCLYEAADEVGMMLESEPVFHFKVPEKEEHWRGHLTRLIKNLRNHPSIILQSVSNELRWRGGGEKEYLVRCAQELDPTRPVFSSDFSGWSLYGDVIGHHYNAPTVFEEWEEFGPDKPMIWDEVGSVWQHDRPMDNGTAGYEVTAQDYATGLYRDGYLQIRQDLASVHDGKVFAGEKHRVNAVVPWDLAYVFFRWQPFNKNRGFDLTWETLTGPGIKQRQVKSGSSTVNIWDSTLPVFEPNPGYYCFERYMRAVRWFDHASWRTFFGGREVSWSARLFYEDLRPVDTLICRVEDLDGAVLSDRQVAFAVEPGEVLEEVVVTFEMPAVAEFTPVRLVRQFAYEGTPGAVDVREASIFAEFGPDSLTQVSAGTVGIGEGSTELAAYAAEAGWPLKEVTADTAPDGSVVMLSGGPEEAAEWQEFVRKGGRIIVFAGAGEAATSGVVRVDRIRDTFKANGTVSSPGGAYSEELQWFGWAPGDEIIIQDVYRGGGQSAYESGRLWFADRAVQPGAYALTTFARADSDQALHLTSLENGRIRILAGCEKEPPWPVTVMLILRLDGGRWIISSPESPVRVTSSGVVDIAPADLRWRSVPEAVGCAWDEGCTPRFDVCQDLPAVASSLETVSGFGIALYDVGVPGETFWIRDVTLAGEKLPHARLLLHGPRHRLLAGIGQAELNCWRGGSTLSAMPIPKYRNYRVVLAGDKDGTRSALTEIPFGRGLQIHTSLNILGALADEPAAVQMFGNMLKYAAAYSPAASSTSGALLAARPEVKEWFEMLRLQTVDATVSESGAGVVTEAEGIPAEVGTVVLDAGSSEICEQWVCASADFVQGGGQALVLGVTEETIARFAEVLDLPLRLTEPYLLERSHCVKAAISWTLRDTPGDLVEYYDDVLIPQPFEPNYDPLLAGIANRDLYWDGARMFEKGIEIAGMDPVMLHPDHRILISNWRIDWRRPRSGGEYIHEAKDLRRAGWFINRDPVVLRIRHGRGCWIFCQLDLSAGGERAERVITQLLTNLGCAVGGATYFQGDDLTFDRDDMVREQELRFAQVAEQLESVQRQIYGLKGYVPDVFEEDGGQENRTRRILLFGDQVTHALADQVRAEIGAGAALAVHPEATGDSRRTLTELEQILAGQSPTIIHFTVGSDDLRRGDDGCPVQSVDEFRDNLLMIVKRLKATGAKLYWAPILPIPCNDARYAGELVEAYNRAATSVMDSNGVYINDLHSFASSQLEGFAARDEFVVTDADARKLGQQTASAITFFGAQ